MYLLFHITVCNMATDFHISYSSLIFLSFSLFKSCNYMYLALFTFLYDQFFILKQHQNPV